MTTTTAAPGSKAKKTRGSRGSVEQHTAVTGLRWCREVGWRHIVAIVAILLCLFPFVYLVSASFNPGGTLTGSNVLFRTIGFENFASGIGGVTVVAYLSALCNLRFTATQYALLSALASIAGRFLTGTTAGSMIEGMGYVNFYLLTTLVAMPGVILFWYMIRSGLADVSIGTAGKDVQQSRLARR